ncbi:unnamed protein product [Vitrella brassicaformis CCMP3155]|uniref:Uncharacterized protein n=1 Tax=Vitrella brassicaformis (strain CCMP3155) TaxID=1169540 RepID=A0A0G4ECM1_VITBC|nr:unnamed protein product [Vitrella brassicaformis CCMP3155]|eukprot:CEL93050.1 unnamed protein product [Vitrella brassicaformis CCMP3155]
MARVALCLPFVAPCSSLAALAASALCAVVVASMPVTSRCYRSCWPTSRICSLGPMKTAALSCVQQMVTGRHLRLALALAALGESGRRRDARKTEGQDATAEACIVMSDDSVACDTFKDFCNHKNYDFEDLKKNAKGQPCCCALLGPRQYLPSQIDCCCDKSALLDSFQGAVCKTNATAEASTVSDDSVACDTLNEACDHKGYGSETLIEKSEGQSCCCSPAGVKKGGGIDCRCESALPDSSEGAVCKT